MTIAATAARQVPESIAMYETFEHTADLGLRVRAPDFPTLLQEAAAGLFSMIVSDLQSIEPREERTFHIAAEADDYLLFDWPNELLYAFDAEGLLLGRFAVRIDEQGLHAGPGANC